MSKALLVCKSITKSYVEGAIKTPVLHNVNFNIMPSELVAIIGSSGSGKSTLLHILGMLDTADRGQILFKNRSLFQLTSDQQASLRNSQIGFIYQFHHLLGDFTAIENVAMPLLISGISMTKAKEKAEELLEQVGISHRSEHRPSELSGGERQRVAIARALVTSPALVLADEPTGNLDQQTAKEIYKLMRHLNQSMGTAFLVVTHDRQLAAHLDRQLSMVDGVLQTEELALNPQGDQYDQ